MQVYRNRSGKEAVKPLRTAVGTNGSKGVTTDKIIVLEQRSDTPEDSFRSGCKHLVEVEVHASTDEDLSNTEEEEEEKKEVGNTAERSHRHFIDGSLSESSISSNSNEASPSNETAGSFEWQPRGGMMAALLGSPSTNAVHMETPSTNTGMKKAFFGSSSTNAVFPTDIETPSTNTGMKKAIKNAFFGSSVFPTDMDTPSTSKNESSYAGGDEPLPWSSATSAESKMASSGKNVHGSYAFMWPSTSSKTSEVFVVPQGKAMHMPTGNDVSSALSSTTEVKVDSMDPGSHTLSRSSNSHSSGSIYSDVM